jgi:hypothetical protein
MKKATKAFFDETWRVCYGMYTRHIKSIYRHYKRHNKLADLTEELPWFTVLNNKEEYRLTRFTREYIMNTFVRYVSYQVVVYNKPMCIEV